VFTSRSGQLLESRNQVGMQGTPRDQDHIKLLDIIQCLAEDLASLCTSPLLKAMHTPKDLPSSISVYLHDLCYNNPEIMNGFIQNPTTYLPLLDDAVSIAQDILFHENPALQDTLNKKENLHIRLDCHGFNTVKEVSLTKAPLSKSVGTFVCFKATVIRTGIRLV
jgi:DNA replicative helicase MCM subunit Mcm2 (Cdc46/Mcm family)